MSLAFCDTDSISQIASAIRLKGGTSASMSFPAGFVSAIGSISAGGSVTADMIAEHNYPSGSISLTVSRIQSYAFAYNLQITNVSASQCTWVNELAFMNCANIKSVHLPNCSIAGGQFFFNCIRLETIYIPNLINAPKSGFTRCSMLSDIYANSIDSVGEQAFVGCIKLPSISLRNCTYIGYGAFYGCESMSAITIPYSSLCYLANSNAFSSTPIEKASYLGYYGSIYVPASLVSAYKSSTNWEVYSSRITAI